MTKAKKKLTNVQQQKNKNNNYAEEKDKSENKLTNAQKDVQIIMSQEVTKVKTSSQM